MHHLYEVVVESPRMWLKIQASCESQDQAMAFFWYRFGRDHGTAIPDEYSTFEAFRLSERSEYIANWETINDHLPKGCATEEFRLAEGPVAWCETLSDDCACHGAEGRLDIVYCSDVGLRGDATRRARKTPNVRHFGWGQEMRRGDASVERYDKERLQSYSAAILGMVKAAQDLEEEQHSDSLYVVIRVDPENPRGEGTLTTVQRDLTDPTGNAQRTSVSRYRSWEVCLGIVDGLMDVDSG